MLPASFRFILSALIATTCLVGVSYISPSPLDALQKTDKPHKEQTRSKKKSSQKRAQKKATKQAERQRKKRDAEFSRNIATRSFTFGYLMGITPKGKNPRKYAIPNKDIKTLDRIGAVYKKAASLIYPANTKEKAVQTADKEQAAHSIPKILHFIWIGPKSFPAESIKNIESWIKKHPQWTINFWTDSLERPLPIPTMTRRLVTEYSFGAIHHLIQKTSNWGEKSDLMRYGILQQEGGIYVDHDVPCKRTFDVLVDHFDFFACLERPHYHKSIDTYIHPCNGLIGSKAQHPIFAATMQYINDVWDEIELKYPKGKKDNEIQRVVERTYDSFALSSIRLRRYDEERRDLILPSCYFYAMKTFNKPEIKKLHKHRLIYAIHTYHGTWK